MSSKDLTDKSSIFSNAANWFPSPLACCAILTLVAAILQIVLFRQKDIEFDVNSILIDSWLQGVLNPHNLSFAFKVCLIVLAGGALAQNWLGRFLIDNVSSVANQKSKKRCLMLTVWLVATVAIVTGLINWGISLICCAILGRRINEILRRRQATEERFNPNYALVGAACYMGMLVFHGGLSGTGPLMSHHAEMQKIKEPRKLDDRDPGQNQAVSGDEDLKNPTATTEESKQESKPGTASDKSPTEQKEVDEAQATHKEDASDALEPEKPSQLAIPLSKTVFSKTNIYASVGLLVVLPIAICLMQFGSFVFRKTDRLPPPIPIEPIAEDRFGRAGLLSTLLTSILGLAGLVAVVLTLYKGGFNVYTIELVAFGIICFSLIGTDPERFVNRLRKMTGDLVPILLLYPLFGGILGIIQAHDGEMIKYLVNEGFPQIKQYPFACETTYLIFTYFAACVLNLFVPSGGEQWLIQAPAFLQGAQEFGVKPEKIILAIAYGDQTTNMIQPFWLMSICIIMRLRPRDVIFYAVPCMILAGAIFIVCLIRL